MIMIKTALCKLREYRETAYRIFANLFTVCSLFSLTTLSACTSCDPDYLEQSLQQAGENRSELEKVLDNYKDNPQKLAAARFLIENMPAHYSYKGDGIEQQAWASHTKREIYLVLTK